MLEPFGTGGEDIDVKEDGFQSDLPDPVQVGLHSVRLQDEPLTLRRCVGRDCETILRLYTLKGEDQTQSIGCKILQIAQNHIFVAGCISLTPSLDSNSKNRSKTKPRSSNILESIAQITLISDVVMRRFKRMRHV